MNTDSLHSAATLLAALRRNDPAAWDTVYQRGWQYVKPFMYQNRIEPEAGLELYQEVAIAFYEKKVIDPAFTLTCAIETFLYAMFRHKWLESLRSSKRAGLVKDIDDPALMREMAALNETHPDFDEPLDPLPDEPAIRAAIEQLGDPCRTVLIQYYYHQTPMADIAAMTNLADANSAKVKRFRCMEQLKKRFGQKK